MNLIKYWLWFRENPYRSPEKLKEIQFTLLKKQIYNAYENSKFYHDKWEANGFHPSQFKSIEDIHRIPIVTKTDFKAVTPQEIVAGGRLEKLHVHRTSGSTGIPLKIFFNNGDLWRKNFMWLRTYLLTGLTFTSKSLVMCDPVDIRKPAWYQKLGIFRSSSINVFNDPKENVKQISKNDYDIMVGYPIDLKMIAKLMLDSKIKVNPKVIYSSAELLDDETRKLVENAFNAPICDFYGSTEGGNLAFQTPHSNFYFVPSDIAYIELKNGHEVKPITEANFGEAIITNLWNFSFPIIRYNIGDFIEVDNNVYNEQSKINFPRISRIVGKYLDFLIFPNNEVVSPHKIKQMLTDLPGVDSFQVFQEKIDTLEVRVAINSSGNFDTVNAEVCKRLSQFLPISVKLTVNDVGNFDRSISRKFKVIESKVGQQYFERQSHISHTIRMFAPGPVNVSHKVLNSILINDIGHREKVFENLYEETTSNLLKIFKANPNKFTVVLPTGSGTCANETVLNSVNVLPRKTIVMSNGEFGERLARQAKLYGHDVIHLKYEWGDELNLVDLNNTNLSDIGLVCVVGLETSTGMVNPIKEIGKIIKGNNQEIIYMVDAVSALGAEDIEVEKFGIDFCTSSAGKAIAGLPGLSMICIRNIVVEETLEDKNKIGYLNLFTLYDYKKRLNQTPHTPAIHLINALNLAVKEYLKTGDYNYREQYSACSKLLYEGITKLGVKPFLINPKTMSRAVTSFYLPDGIEFNDLKDRLYAKGFLIYGGKKYLEEKRVFQVANMGNITIQDCYSFLEAFKKSINGI